MVNRILPAALLLAACAFAQAPAGDPIPEDFLLAETPWSAARAAGRGPFAVASASEQMTRGAGDLLPVSADALFAPFGSAPSLFGAARGLFAPGPRDSLTGVIVGNEVGDQLWQEIGHKARIENRTPTTQAFGALPLGRALLWGELRQVDHWSSKYVSARSRRATNGNWEDEIDKLHSWFGENYPDFSVLGGGYRWNDGTLEADVQFRGAWWWPLSPGSLREIPLFVNALQTELRFSNWRLRTQYYDAEIRSADSLDGERASIGEFLLSYDAGAWRPWILVRVDDASERFVLQPGRGQVALAGVDHGFRPLPFLRLAGSHWAGNGVWGVNDTLELEQRVDGHLFSEALFLRLSNRYNPLEEWTEVENGETVADLSHCSTWQQYGLRTLWSSAPFGPFRLSLSSTPWVALDLPAFESSEYKWRDSRWTRRGRERTVEGALWGAQQRLVVDFSRCPCRLWQLEVVQESDIAGPWSRMDLTPADWRVALRHFSKLPGGLELGAALLYTTGAVIRNRSPEPFEEDPHPELDVTLRQRLFGDRAQVWFSLLNPLADDKPLYPDGPEDRFRALAGIAVRI